MEESVSTLIPPEQTTSTAVLLREASRPAKTRRLLSALLMLLGGGALAFIADVAAPHFLVPEPPPRVLSVRPRKIESVLHEIGSISAHIERSVLTSFAGEITWRAEDGTLVEIGDPVVTFDAKVLQDDVELREK